jgi:hypothetical protein
LSEEKKTIEPLGKRLDWFEFFISLSLFFFGADGADGAEKTMIR